MKSLLLFVLIIIFSLNSKSQSLSVFDIDTSAFPTMKAKFYAFDNNWKQITNLSISDFNVSENGNNRNVTYVSCPPVKPPDAISVVLTIDISGSMSGEGLVKAKAAAKAFVNQLALGKSECAINSFDTQNFLNQDFTTDKQKLLNAIENLQSNGGTDFNAALINPMSGGLLVAEKGKFKKVVILLTDGYAEGDEAAIINKANSMNADIYCVVLNLQAPEILKNISLNTGGKYYDRVSNQDEAETVYLEILHTAQNDNPCELNWTSIVNCYSGIVKTEFTCLSQKATKSYKIPFQSIAKLLVTPVSINFGGRKLNRFTDTTIIITAKNSDFVISNISKRYGSDYFNIVDMDFPLIIPKNSSKEITIGFEPKDSGLCYIDFEIQNNLCKTDFSVYGGFPGKRMSNPTLKLAMPNGNEKFVVASDTLITWNGISETDTVSLEYTIDNGITWNKITEKATGLKYVWKNIPKPASDKCKVRVKQFVNGAFDDPAPKIEWQKTYGGSNNDLAYSVRQTFDGGYIVAGYTESYDGDITDKKSGMDFWILKLNPVGSIEWQKTFGGNSNDIPYTIIQTNEGGYIIAGFTLSRDGDININKGQYDAWIVKISSYGTIEWQKTYGGTNWDEAYTIRQTSDGGYIFAGYGWSNDGDLQRSIGIKDYWIVKINGVGVIEWQKVLGGSEYDDAFSIEQTNDKGYIIAGFTHSPDGDITNFKGNRDYWIVKLDSLGYIIWQKTYGGSQRDEAYSIQQTVDDGYIVAGSTQSTNGDVIGKSYLTNYDYWILKLDSLGSIEWQKLYGGTNNDMAKSIQQTFDGGYVIAGSGDLNDYLIVKLDPDGKLLWQKTLGGNDHDDAYSIQQTFDGGYIIAGYTLSVTGDVTGKKGAIDYWIVKLSPEGGILQQDESDTLFSIVEPQVSSNDIDMGKVLVGSKKDSVVTDFIVNNADWKFRVDSIYIEGADASAFKLVSGHPKYDVESYKSHFAEFNFSPLESRAYYAQIVIITQSDILKKNIIGEGIQPQFDLVNEFIDFGKVYVGSYKDTLNAASIKNTGNTIVNISSTKHSKPNDLDFTTIAGAGPFSLGKGDTAKMDLRFRPSSIGRTNGVLEFHHIGIGSPVKIHLFGEGIFAGIAKASLIIDTIQAIPGEIVEASIVLFHQENLDLSGISGINLDISYNPTLLLPLNYSIKNGESISINNLPVNINLNDCDTLTKIRFKAGLGNAEGCDLILSNIEAVGGNVELTSINGYFKLLGICEEGGTRLFNPYGEVSINAINPNPAKEEILVKINVIEEGFTKLYLSNTLGNKIFSLFNENILKTGEYSFSLPVKELNSGLYFIVLETPTVRKVEKIVIEK